MTEINPFSHKEKNNQLNINDNFTESASENDFGNFSQIDYQSFNSLDSYFPELPNKKFPNFPIKSIFNPDLFLEKEKIKSYICGLCENVCEDAVKAKCKCEQLFCKKCLQFFYEREKKCPLCEKSTKGELIEADYEDKIIKSMKMKCINHINNCKWEEECGKYKEHITAFCQEEIVNCANKKYGCVMKFKRKELFKHLKICEYERTTCEKCHLSFPKKEENSHINICDMEMVSCPFNCGKNFLRKELELHKNNCDFALIKCPFSALGCQDEFKKRDENKILEEQQNKHMLLLGKCIIDVKNLLSQNEKRMKNIEIDIQLLKANGMKNDENEKLFLNHKRKNSLFKEEVNESRLNEEEKNDELTQSKTNSNGEKSMSLIENETVYDLLEETKKLFYIKNYSIEAIYLRGKKHYYVFFDKKYDIPRNIDKKFIFTFKLLSNTKWLAMGLCDRKVVEDNKYEFSPENNKNDKSTKKSNNGTYYLSTNKVAWNCNNIRQCKNLKLEGENKLNKIGSTFKFIINPTECELEIYFNGFKVVLFNDVRCFKNKFLSPCLIFLTNCKVETIFSDNDKNL